MSHKLPYTYPTLMPQLTLFGLAQEITKMFQRIAKAFNEPPHGPTTARPTGDLAPREQFFDDTLNKPIWWDADTMQWRDASGTVV